MKKAISFSILLVGFTAMSSQIILIREFLSVFYGNELSIGFVLAGWLAGGAIGSSLLGRFADRLNAKIASFSICQILLSIFFPLGILAIRSIKIIFNMNTGEIMPLFSMIVSSFTILAPICMLLGYMFSLGCSIYESRSHMRVAKIGEVYVLESIGAIVGGLSVSFILIRIFNSFQVMGILSLLNIMAALFLISTSKELTKRPFLSTVIIFAFVAAVSLWIFNGWNRLNEYSLRKQWRGYELVASKDSIYGNITLVKNIDETSFFDNGLHLYTVPDEQNAEEAVHFALLEDKTPRNVLLVGGGVGGLVGEILKHPVAHIDYVELDPLIIKMAEKHLRSAYYRVLKDPRVSIKNVDGRLFIKNTTEKYDCVIIHLGDPYTAQLNRYYTVEFFKEVYKILDKGGVVSFGLTSSESYINKDLANFLKSIYATLHEVFDDVKIIPGETAHFLASNQKGILTYDYNLLAERTSQRNLNIKYVREYYLFSKMSSEKISYVENSLKKINDIKINYDFRPISYYYNIIFWTGRFRDSIFNTMLKRVTEKIIWKLLATICFLLLLSGLVNMRLKKIYKKYVLSAVMTSGLSATTFQVVVLLSFQIIYGYMFYKLGFILTSFMIGLAIGGWLITKIMPKIKNDLKVLIWNQTAISVYPLIAVILLFWISGSKSGVLYWSGANLVFPFLSALSGFIGGFLFPLANKIYLGEGDKIGQVSGLNYGVDLLGSCLGAILTGIFLVPLLGIPKTCLAISLLNFTVLTLLIVSSRKEEVAQA